MDRGILTWLAALAFAIAIIVIVIASGLGALSNPLFWVALGLLLALFAGSPHVP